jgi:hypothetical protein
MGNRCPCGHLLAYPFEALGCIECGTACCSNCGISLESVTYCARCASTRLEMPGPSGFLSWR